MILLPAFFLVRNTQGMLSGLYRFTVCACCAHLHCSSCCSAAPLESPETTTIQTIQYNNCVWYPGLLRSILIQHLSASPSPRGKSPHRSPASFQTSLLQFQISKLEIPRLAQNTRNTNHVGLPGFAPISRLQKQQLSTLRW